ncbi:MAG: sensor domain-containing diguanylate cyclase [Myxococcales bacterium]|nr:sensor domain-containing diguanylate cyclase [Myxococcales bacterium]
MKRNLELAMHVAGGTIMATLACIALMAGVMAGASLRGEITAVQLLFATTVTLLLVYALLRRLGFAPASSRVQQASWWYRAEAIFRDLELCLALIAALYTSLFATGGLHSPLYPLLYAAIAFAITVLSRAAAIAVLGAALAIEGATVARALAAGPVSASLLVTVALHALFIIGAALLHYVLLRALVVRYRVRQARRLHDVLVEKEQAARDLRFLSAALGPTSRAARPRPEEEAMLSAAGTDAIHDSAVWVLRAVKRLLGARSVVWMWPTPDGSMRVGEAVSDSPDLAPASTSLGLLAAVMREAAPVLASATKLGQIPYYEREHAGSAFAAVPVLEHGHVRGAVCADRDKPFTEAEAALLSSAAVQLGRAVQIEQVFRSVERSKYEYERFYQAAALLGQALTPEQVHETAFDAAAAIADYDVAIITLYDRERGKHRVAAVRIRRGGEGLIEEEDLAGIEFRDNAGLASMVVKNRHYLPASGDLRELSAPVFTKKHTFAEARSLLVVPLLCVDDAVGTMTFLAREEKRFGKDVREMLTVIANQVAVSMVNGLLYKRMETMATTDGLTGLTNHRAFQERFGDLIERATRHGHKAAMLLCDVDFFKKVNDNYGHPVGDEVLRRVARVLQEVARKIDISARYGGEEFAVVLEATDAETARAVAERLRTEVAKLVIETEKGPLQVTMSIGIASYPDDAANRAEMIERSDLALYHAKHSGRNRVITYGQYVRERNESAAGRISAAHAAATSAGLAASVVISAANAASKQGTPLAEMPIGSSRSRRARAE